MRDDILMNLCTKSGDVENVKKNIIKDLSKIALTKAIVRKICFLYIKVRVGIPILIMGETGIGKSKIVQYLSYLINGSIFTLNVHAGLK